jgi:hypothetical protein
MQEPKYLVAAKCPICKKDYYPAPQHAYRVGAGKGVRVCSYHCQRKWEKEHKFKTRDESARRVTD